MRVIIVSRIYRPEPSAASFYLGAVADALTEQGDQVTVLTSRVPRGMSRPPTRERVRTAPVLRDRNGYVRGYLPYLSFDIPLAVRLLFGRRPDVVLVEPPPTTGVVVRVVCALRRVPYVYDAADVWSDAASMATTSTAVVRVLRAMERFAMQGSSALVTISQGVLDRVRALGVDRPMTIAGFGADSRSFAYRAVPRERILIYAGSYSSWHGAEVLLDALARLRNSGHSYRLRFIGNGDRDVLESRAHTLGVASAVEFHTPVSAAELVPILASATASLATLRPGTGYDYAFTSKVYSSLAVGCPVVFAGPGPTGPFLREATLAVRAGSAVGYDPTEIADALLRLAEDPPTPAERARLAEWTAREHSMAAVARRVADVLRSVTHTTGSSS